MDNAASRETLLAELGILYAIDSFRDDPGKDLTTFAERCLALLVEALALDAGEVHYADPMGRGFLPGAARPAGGGSDGAFAGMRERCLRAAGGPGAVEPADLAEGERYVKLLALEGKALGFVCCAKAGGVGEVERYLLRAAASQMDSGIRSLIDHAAMVHHAKLGALMLELDSLRDASPEDVDGFLAGSARALARGVGASGAAAMMLDQFVGDCYPVLDLGGTSAGLGPALAAAIKDGAPPGSGADSCVRVLELHGARLCAIGLERPGGFDPWAEETIDAACAQLDSGVEAIVNQIKLRQKTRIVDTLYGIDGLRDQYPDNFKGLLDAIGKVLAETLESEMGFIVLYEKGEPKVHCVTGKGGIDLPFFIELAAAAIANGKTTLLKAPRAGVRSSLCIPLILHGNIIGVFGVLNSLAREQHNHFDVDIIEAIGSQADTAIFESQEKLKIRSVFKRYVAEAVIDEMLQQEGDYLSGKRKYMSVLFADMRGFTSLSEKLREPELVVATINEYLAEMTDVIFGCKATLDKFVGDEVMALFGTPLDMEDHALRAVRTAVLMQEAMGRLSARWKLDGRDEGKIGIGINTGIMIAGNIGCEKMTDYTVLGPSVNLAARLCGKAAGGQVLIPGETKACIEKFCAERSIAFEYTFRELEPVSLKGIVEPLPVFEVIY